IIGMSDLLQDTTLSPEQQEYVQRLGRAATSLMDLLNDVLDISRIEAGHFELESIPLDLHDLAERTVELLAARATAKGIELMCFVHPDVPQYALGDPTRLRQVLVNLVGNAIKFTEVGEVVLRIDPCNDPSDPTAFQFSVWDTGIGIPANKLQTIFGDFSQVDSSTTRKYGGSGLGLTISQRIVTMMGSALQVSSTEGEGSTFSFVLRLTRTDAPRTTQDPTLTTLKGHRVLIVDDNDTNRMIIREHLARLGVRAIEAPDGLSTLAALHEAQERGEPFHLAILDYHLPDMNGMILAQAIRQRADCTRLPLVMHTSQVRNDHTLLLRSLGVNSYLYKPISRNRLLQSVAAALGQTADAPKEPTQDQSALPLPPVHILLAEDLEDNRDVIALFLKETSYHLDMAENGAVALQKFQTGTYDLVLMDMQIPVMDGLQATMVMRQWEREQQRRPTPIVALTANAFKEESEKSLGAGCTAHLTKPIKKKTLLTAITHYANAWAERAA
ncbi:MAG: response regulator, partial [Nitrospira sp.]